MLMDEIFSRKDDHIHINRTKDVDSALSNGFEKFAFEHQALPELDLSAVNTGTRFLGKNLQLPLMISSMTGGTREGDMINQRLAEAAQQTGIAMGIGSQRGQIESGEYGQAQELRKIAPDVPLFANLGAVQLNYGFKIDKVQQAIDMIEADGLILHLNPLQEALQPEGNSNFAGLARKIQQVCEKIPVPVIVKEVGWGISVSTAKQLAELGVAALDVAGAGGTSWSEVEKYRSASESRFRIASHFRSWGIATAEALQRVHQAIPGLPLVASGGMTQGMEIAKAVSLGASIAGIARPFLIAVSDSTAAAIALVDEIRTELKITMFAAGAPDISALSRLKLSRRTPNYDE